MTTNLLVTGGAGFVGSNFIRLMLSVSENCRITNLDLLTYAGSLRNIWEVEQSSRYHFIRGDICNGKLISKLLRDNDIDMVVNFAAETHVDRSIKNPEQFVQTNVVGTYQLLEAFRKYYVENKNNPRAMRFLQISTDEVYGSLKPREAPFTENSSYRPRSPYAASKAAADHLVASYFSTYELPVLITHCTNNYGPYQYPEKLIPLLILNALQGEDLPLYGDGKQIRDWIYVVDHCRALMEVLAEGAPGEKYLIGGQNQRTNLEVAELVCGLIDELRPGSMFVPHRNLICHVADRPGHDRRYAVDTGKIRRELNWVPETGLEEGLKKTIVWYLSNPGWVSAILGDEKYQHWVRKNYQLREEEL